MVQLILSVLFYVVWLSGADNVCSAAQANSRNENRKTTLSGLKMWVDPDTPEERHKSRSSRGDTWELVMSDEFNSPGRSFRPGDDHLWTSLEKPDGVNDAMEVYAHNKTTTVCDADTGVCSFQIELDDSVVQLQVWNSFMKTPGFQNVTFFYRGGMVQTWNKFCLQGGMVEVRAQLPGAMSKSSGNPDSLLGPTARAKSLRYYPTWPGIWMMGNLGRAIFSGSTNRMWPFSYDECDPHIFKPSNQRISACEAEPGSGMNPHQGRGAPEIDIVEGGGTTISASIQVGPGMPPNFRVVPPEDENVLCIYSSSCKTPGANTPGIPESVYIGERGHKSWYQQLRYAANNFCQRNASERQRYSTVKASLRAGIEDNVCSLKECPASLDINSDLGYMYPHDSERWGVNTNGTCFSAINSYMGEFICSPGNPDPGCKPLKDAPVLPSGESTFAFQMDALSANFPVHLAVYTDFVTYQVEWVPGPKGYVRWMLSDQPLYEIPAQTITEPPQDKGNTNPRKIMIEEPMYIIFNVAMSSKWGAQPPNPKNPCRGDGKDPIVNRICDSFPMHLKIDYIRVYQDLSNESIMSVGCDPKTHPTRQWIIDHLEEYEDDNNPLVVVQGRAFCRSDSDCTVRTNHGRGARNAKRPGILTGKCVNRRCACVSGAWTGPRCIVPSRNGENRAVSFGPPLVMAVCVGVVLIVMGLVSCVAIRISRKKRIEAAEVQRKLQQEHQQFVQLRRQSSHHLQSAWSSG